MVFITGDTHGDFTRIERFCERFSPARDDSVKTQFSANIGPPNQRKVRQTSLKEAGT